MVPLQATLLGPQTRQSAMLKDGMLDLFIEDLPAFRDLVPALDLLSLPYIFTSAGHQKAFLESTGFDQIVRQPLLQQGSTQRTGDGPDINLLRQGVAHNVPQRTLDPTRPGRDLRAGRLQ